MTPDTSSVASLPLRIGSLDTSATFQCTGSGGASASAVPHRPSASGSAIRKLRCMGVLLSLAGGGVRIDFANGQIVVSERETPALILFLAECRLIREQLFRQIMGLRSREDVAIGNHHPVVPTLILARMQPRVIDGVAEHPAQLLFLVEQGDLVLTKEAPELVGFAPFDTVDPFDQVRWQRRLRCRLRRGLGGTRQLPGR